MKLAIEIFVLFFIPFICFISSSCAQKPKILKGQKDLMVIDFKDVSEKGNWLIINDGVMGGLSKSEIVFSDSGTAVFKGTVSLENNGGFASTRSNSRLYGLSGYAGLLLRVKGDGKNYQLCLRTDKRFDGISYRYIFETEPDTWITLRAPFSEFTPVFRGRILEDVSPIFPSQIKQIGFLIADKQSGAFHLEIEWIKAYK
jgi:monofunctional biosynthetic peptidoglycan transglycosylase